MANRDERRVERASAGGEHRTDGRSPHLQIYVADHCGSCDFSYEVAKRIETRYPHVEVEIVDVEQFPEKQPATVFATPTYVLDGRIWSLGNPSERMIADAFSGECSQ